MLIYDTRSDDRDRLPDTLNIHLYRTEGDDVSGEFPEVFIGPDTTKPQDSEGCYPTTILIDKQIDLVEAVSRIPEAPTTDGTYTLKAIVVDGVATYKWE